VGHYHNGFVTPSRVRAPRIGDVGVAPVISLLTTLLVGGRGGCCGCCISGFGCCSGTSVVVAVAVADEEHWVAKAIRPTMKR